METAPFFSRPSWQLGTTRPPGVRRWFSGSQVPYHLDLMRNQSLIIGASESGLSQILLRLAANAAAHRWKVVYLGALGSMREAIRFVATMQAASYQHIRVYPNHPHRSHPTTNSAGTLQLFPIEGDDDPFLSSDPPTEAEALMTRRDEPWSFAQVEAVYLALHAWLNPPLARTQARALLSELLAHILTPSLLWSRTLLILKHPTLLWELSEIVPLFSVLEATGGSLCVAVRSLQEEHHERTQLLDTTSALLVHASSGAAVRQWAQRHPSFLVSRALQQPALDRDAEATCAVLTHGRLTPVSLVPVVSAVPALAQAQQLIAAFTPVAPLEAPTSRRPTRQRRNHPRSRHLPRSSLPTTDDDGSCPSRFPVHHPALGGNLCHHDRERKHSPCLRRRHII